MTKLPPELEKIRDENSISHAMEKLPYLDWKYYDQTNSHTIQAYRAGFNACYEAIQARPPIDKSDEERAKAWVERSGNIGTTAGQMFIDGMLEERARQQVQIEIIKKALSDLTTRGGYYYVSIIEDTLAKLSEHE